MADIIRLRGSPHDQTQSLLPWYLNGTLDPAEMASVEAHLRECAECRSDLECERRLAPMVANLSMDAEHGWEAMSSRIDARGRPGAVSWLRRRVTLGWAVGGQAAAAVAASLLVYVAMPNGQASQTYHALGSAPAKEPGNVVLMFQPDTSERQIRDALIRVDARIVDGPNASGAYLARVSPADRATRLQQLRNLPQIMLSEPVDAGPPE